MERAIGRTSEERTVVLAVSQDVTSSRDPEVPDTDFGRLGRWLGAVVVGNRTAGGFPLMERIAKATALDFQQALHILRTYPGASVYVSFSERVGIPLAMMLRWRKRRAAHLLIAHRLDSRAKRSAAALTGWVRGVDRVITIAQTQHICAEGMLGLKARFIRACVTDDAFYAPCDGVQQEEFILSVGSESRDYPTLIEAAAGGGWPVKIVASSLWARKAARKDAPQVAGVEFLPRISYAELRDLYRRAKLVVLPLEDVSYAAGHNGLLEAQCANKALIVSRSRGIMDYVGHSADAYATLPNRADDLYRAIDYLWKDSTARSSLEAGAAKAIRELGGLDGYVEYLANQISEMLR